MLKQIRTALFLITVICMTASAVSADEAAYTEKSVKVFTEGKESGELPLRFYDAAPHIPYMGMNEYSQFMRQQSFSLQTGEDGSCVFTNWNGAELHCDPEAGVMTVPDWNAFFALPLPLEDRALGLKDTCVHYARITEIEYEGDPEEVRLDFAKYGIAFYCDGMDVYLPVSVLSNMMTDIATNYMLYNGENLYAQRVSLDGGGIKGLYDSEMLKAQIQGEARPEDVVRQCYADLCFNFDSFFGHPGKSKLDAAIAEKGLDQALTDLGEDGLKIKNGLLSADLADYISAMNRLFLVYLSDGHTAFTGAANLISDPAVKDADDFVAEMAGEVGSAMLESKDTLKQALNLIIPKQRQLVWGGDTYREHGHTAVIRLDSFIPDEAAWDSYYKGDGELPSDSLGIVVEGLKKASENPEIENVIFDLSCNGGGSPDVMMAILAMTTGQNELYGRNVITGQTMTAKFQIDTNFDGVFDEKDQDVRYDFNYGVLVTRYAFSCGNLFPIIIQEAGAVLMGEPSSGGSCCIQVGSDAEGFDYVMSSGQWLLTDRNGESVERGCSIDLPMEAGGSDAIDALAALIGVDTGVPVFTDYYDDARLDGMMNEYFEEQEDLNQAA